MWRSEPSPCLHRLKNQTGKHKFTRACLCTFLTQNTHAHTANTHSYRHTQNLAQGIFGCSAYTCGHTSCTLQFDLCTVYLLVVSIFSAVDCFPCVCNAQLIPGCKWTNTRACLFTQTHKVFSHYTWKFIHVCLYVSTVDCSCFIFCLPLVYFVCMSW